MYYYTCFGMPVIFPINIFCPCYIINCILIVIPSSTPRGNKHNFITTSWLPMLQCVLASVLNIDHCPIENGLQSEFYLYFYDILTDAMRCGCTQMIHSLLT